MGHVAFVQTYADGDYFYAYDHRDLRVGKISAAGPERFVYDAGGRLLSDLRAAAAGPTMEYVYLSSEPIAVVIDPDGDASTGASVYVLGTDHLGTPMRAFDTTTGDTVWAADYEIFGKAWTYVPGSQNPPAFEINLRFPGQYFDEETGLHYNGARYYDPNTGRYLTVDPVDDQSGMSPYAYAGGNPVLFVDPTGLLRVVRGSFSQCEDCGVGETVDSAIQSARTGAQRPECRAWFAARGLSIDRLLADGEGPGLVMRESSAMDEARGEHAGGRAAADYNPAASEIRMNCEAARVHFSAVRDLIFHELAHYAQRVNNQPYLESEADEAQRLCGVF